MDAPSEDLLIANGLVQSPNTESHEFACSMCTDDTSFNDWEQHIGAELHIRTLEQFNLTFEKSGTKIHCKLCCADIDWDALEAHGKSHQIVPWTEPEDKYQTFFENRMIGLETEFYCCLCDIIFPEWATAFLHIGDQKHQNFKGEQNPLADEFSSKLPVDVTYETLVNDCLLPFDEKMLECRICDRKNVEFSQIVRHVKSFLHLWDKITFASKLKKEIASKTDVKLIENYQFTESTSKQFDTKKINENQPCQNLTCYYLEKLDEANLRCNVCDCLVFANRLNINIHVAGKFHADSLKKYGCHDISLKEGNTYYCECCKLDILELEEVYLHVKGLSHSFRYMPTEIPKTAFKIPIKIETPVKLKNIFEPASPSSADYYIAKLTDTESRCELRECNVSASPANISRHVTGTSHASALEKYGCDKISRKSENIFYCECCDRDILGHESVWTHIKESKHVNTVTPSNKQQSPISDKSPIKAEVPKQLEPYVPKIVNRPRSHYYIRRPRPPKPLEPLYPNIVAQTIPSNYIKRENATDSCCVVCKVKLFTSEEIDNHIVASGHEIAMKRYGCDNVSLVFGNLYYCRCCNCRIFGNNNVYLHVKGRQHEIEHLAEQSRKKKLKEANLLSVEPKPNKVTLSSILTSEVTKMVEEVKSKEAAYATRPRLNRVRLPNPQKIFADERTPCNVCNVIFTSSAELHTHMASHFSGDFVRSNVNKNSNIPTIDYAATVPPGLRNTVTENPGSIETARTSYESLESSGSSDDNTNCFEHTLSCDSDVNSDTESQKNHRTPKTIMQRVMQLLNFDKDYIYDMKDKLRDIDLGMKLCLITDQTSIYCLVCRKIVENTLQDYFEHLCSLNHCDYLEKMERDDELFDHFPEQFSDLALAHDYMEEISDEVVRCFVCHEEVSNIDNEIRDHIDEENHERIREEMNINAKQNFEDAKSRMQCDWYNVQKYWCVLCSANYDTEMSFVKHLESPNHAIVVNQSDNFGRALIYDFCAPCALLWYGYRCTYAYHCNVPSHKWLMRDGHYVSPELPELAKSILAKPEQYINDTIEYLDSVAAKEREKEQCLMQDLEKALKRSFYNARAYTYGSRVSGLGGPDSDIDVFLDCGNMYNGSVISKDRISSLIISVHQCLSRNSQSWDLNELLTNCRTPIIKAHHRATGLSCDISFENGLSVENTKLIKSFNDVYPPCRKMILFLKKWLALCKLSGSDRISSYALYWHVIFYLQKESILPSIATLTRMNSRSYEIAGWEVGITREYSYNKAESNFSIKELLLRFFKFYADYDFRHEVICPLLGDAIKKREFADHRNLPKEMRPYVDHMKKPGDPEPLRIDSPMCVQDPLDLQRNITKAVSKVYLSRFRTCCSKSVDVLLSSL